MSVRSPGSKRTNKIRSPTREPDTHQARSESWPASSTNRGMPCEWSWSPRGPGLRKEADFRALSHAMRSAMRDELGDLLAEGGAMRRTMRSEVEAALQNWGGRSPGTQIVEPICPELGKESNGDLEDADDAAELPTTPRESPRARRGSTHSFEAAGAEHFSNFVKSATTGDAHEHDSLTSDVGPLSRAVKTVERLMLRLQDVEEPRRTGRVAHFITGEVFEAIVLAIIILHTLWMLHVADVQIRRPSHDDTATVVVEWIFQTLFTIEMILRISVHRYWFFTRRLNVFELGLVIAGFVTLGTASDATGSALRIFRTVEIGRAARVLRITTHLRQLRALIVCLQGSLKSLLWSMVMIFLVYGIFSLFLVQIITSHLIDTGEAVETTIFYESFGSIGKSILTLHMASTGGDDWSNAYQLVQTTGVVGSAVFLAFIIFMQFALLNIITGIFVESALAVLRPDPETIARELCHQDHVHAEMLDSLCRAVDADDSGKLRRDEFEDGLHRKHIPLLLKTLGLQRHHLVDFFDYMADVQGNDGQVDIGTFVNGCMLLKGGASNFELHKLHAEVKANHGDLKRLLSGKPEK